MTKGIPKTEQMVTATSIHHKTCTRTTMPWPYAGTAMRAVALISVHSAMGKVPAAQEATTRVGQQETLSQEGVRP